MEIRMAQPGDARMAAPLIYLASDDIAALVTGTSEKGKILAQLSHFFRQPGNRLSYQNTQVAEENGMVAGLVIAYYGADSPQLDQPINAYIRETREVQDFALQPEANANEWYIDTLAVDPSFGGRGIGTALIQAAERRGVRLGYQQAALLVSHENSRAQRLYTRLGYQQDAQMNLYQQIYLHMIRPLA